ncbi:RHS repeat-associated core domain-containing protein [Pseudomonas sp. zfem004]|uniref:RHS repeat-associated core domain-containing protein n=1 Tax=Pseudomonas sp. zfem004 TaxID=3078199 RepID=UPI002927C9A5|nr:RHS repeat-associated core domain-containing protein [Pseudomonas sp. zfem004]MDU9405520.1 RHS repeat-associated core domain-containing protein [Pseudomonas sp. zfem004]
MSSESSVHSNAFNFMSFMESGVDNRTGQYTLSIKLPDLGANFFQGPNFELALNFNPLNTIDSGWGRGWNLQLTQYTEHNGMLTTFTGESFKVSGAEGTRLHMPEQKLAHFHLYTEPAGPGGARRYRVVHRSGLVEILEVMGSQRGLIALPVEVYSPQGHKLALSYTPFNPEYVMLAAVRDGSDQILLEIERESGQVEFRERPYQGPEGEPVATYKMILQEADRRVTSIVLPSAEQASWRFVYRDVLGHVCLEQVTTPTGAREYLQYTDGGHLFPGNSRPPLPRVTRHTVEPGLGQVAFQTNYSYPSGNFLGHGTTIPWSDDGLDNLYKHTGNYQYQTVQSLCDASNRELKSITRTFNRFHLPVSVRTVQNGSIHELMTTYDLKDNLPFAQQVATLQLPIAEQTRWSKDGHTPPSRLETLLTQYDSHGNTVWRKQPNGVIERSIWFEPQAEDGFPGDPYGFKRYLKSKTVTPSPDGEQGAPELVHTYTYRQLPALAGHTTQLEPWLAEHSQTLSHQGQTLQHTLNRYVDAPGSSLLHGRLYQQVRTLGKLQTTTQYHFKALTDELSGHPVLETTTELLGYDGTERSSVQRRSLLLGETVFERDENGVHLQREHDALRRVTREWVSPGTDYAASKLYTYTLCANHGDIARQWVRNARGVTTLTELDGLGRIVKESRDNIHEQRPDTFFELLTVAYDALGNRVSETHTDWLKGTRLLTLTTGYRYDDWGEQCCVIGPDGVEEHDALDPIGSSFHAGPVRRSWREGGTLDVRTSAITLRGSNTRVTQRARVKSANRETWLNLFEKPVKVRRLNALGDPLAERTYLYDGLGRTLEETDERRHTTTFSYDPWDRMLSTLLPEGTRLSRTYAEHSSEDLPASLVVTPANVNLPARQIGEQYHDGLDRLIGVSSGKRVEYFQFREGESQPRWHITPAGKRIELDYNLQLTNEPISYSAPDDPASFTYDKVSARLQTSKNPQGTRSFDYNLANQLVAEHWDEPGGKRWSTTHEISVSDRLINTYEANGVATQYTHDSYGRLQVKHQGDVQVQFAYDELGRLKLLTSTDLASASSLETHIEYDDQDRETMRTWRQAGQAERTLEQSWAHDNLLQGRHLRQAGVSLLEESFEYDGRARLIKHECNGPELPVDAQGRQMTSQVFGFDAYDNINMTFTTFAAEPSRELALFSYAESDPCQLIGIDYSPPRNEPNPRFSYDANGNLTRDERGRQLHYDSQNRLLGIDQASNSYRYDAGGLLVASASGTGAQNLRLYDGAQLRMAVSNGLQTLYCHHGEQPLGQQQSGPGAQPPLLLHTSASHSVVAESLGTALRSSRYSAYGEHHSEQPVDCALGYNGEALDPDSGWYLLGNGYRAYNPVLMRFHSPDALSPFGAGGLNYYGYCQGNPVTFRDPTGHYSVGFSGTSQTREELERTSSWAGPQVSLASIIVPIVTTVITLALIAITVLTAGTAAPATGPAMAGVISAGSTATAASTTTTIAGVAVSAATAATLKKIVLASLISSTVVGIASSTMSVEAQLSGSEDRMKVAEYLNYTALILALPAMVISPLTSVKAITPATSAKAFTPLVTRSGSSASLLDKAYAIQNDISMNSSFRMPKALSRQATRVRTGAAIDLRS